MTNCLELYIAGAKKEGIFEIDPTGSRSNENSFQVYCKQGWTYILQRGQFGNSQVS